MPSTDNPADMISRGVTEEKLWWDGPNWLLKEYVDWPKINEM